MNKGYFQTRGDAWAGVSPRMFGRFGTVVVISPSGCESRRFRPYFYANGAVRDLSSRYHSPTSRSNSASAASRFATP